MLAELFVSRQGTQIWAALREDGTVVELQVEREGERGAVGHVLTGKVTRILPGIQSAFVDLGLDRDAFLHNQDLILPGDAVSAEAETPDLEWLGEEDEEPDDSAPRHVRPRAAKGSVPPIQDRLKEGRELMVQITREATDTKGARVTGLVSLAGRLLVYMPLSPHRGVSRRISDPQERARLRDVLASLEEGSGGFIVRTAGKDARESALQADAARLVDTWKRIRAAAAARPAPALVYSDLDLLRRLLRDVPRFGLDSIIVDDESDYRRALEYLRGVDPVLASRVRLHAGPTPLLEAHGLDQEIERALRPKVWLRSGGFLIIEQTEALVIIDVNTGKFLGGPRPEQTVLRANLEAAEEVARQLRLRDLGGIVVVDFIDMNRPDHRRQVVEAVQTALVRDRARSRVVGFAGLGLLLLTRKKARRGLQSSLTRPCPVCSGHGWVKTPDTVALEAVAEIRRLLTATSVKRATLRAQPEVVRAVGLLLKSDGGGIDIEHVRLELEEDSSLRPDQFDVIAMSEGRNDEPTAASSDGSR